jgi:hypothetical protein
MRHDTDDTRIANDNLCRDNTTFAFAFHSILVRPSRLAPNPNLIPKSSYNYTPHSLTIPHRLEIPFTSDGRIEDYSLKPAPLLPAIAFKFRRCSFNLFIGLLLADGFLVNHNQITVSSFSPSNTYSVSVFAFAPQFLGWVFRTQLETKSPSPHGWRSYCPDLSGKTTETVFFFLPFASCVLCLICILWYSS